MHEFKLVQFLQDKVLNHLLIKKNCKTLPLNLNDKSANKDDQTLKYNTIQGYKTALVDFWSYRKSRGLHNHDHPNRNVVKVFMKNCQQGQHAMKKAAFEDRGKRTIADGYNEPVLRSILDQFWQQSHSNKPTVVGGNLHSYLNYLLGHLFLA